ncbi:DUF1398 domain-containing protein [Epilithonimonas caeni]|uniref:DUF1398 domain-containing protein n=1 Tax=Epilithonimonas caeni TaxID=365343 RepID=UPI0029350725|nr:DUF1398 domain-containing protein [Epilithonimonas caeni]
MQQFLLNSICTLWQKKRFFTITSILSNATLHRNHKAKAVKKLILKSTIIFASLSIMAACNSTNHLTIKNKEQMFTVEQIKAAHSKVRSGADFPSYIKEIKELGVTYYETFVTDGHTDYYSENDYKTASPAKYEPLTIALESNKEQFKVDLKRHQQGKTDYPTFCNDCAKSGIEKWAVCMEKMTCTYYDLAGNEILVEQIPQ